MVHLVSRMVRNKDIKDWSQMGNNGFFLMLMKLIEQKQKHQKERNMEVLSDTKTPVTRLIYNTKEKCIHIFITKVQISGNGNMKENKLNEAVLDVPGSNIHQDTQYKVVHGFLLSVHANTRIVN